MSLVDMAKAAEVAGTVLAVTQVVKTKIPEKFIPVFGVLLGVAFSFSYHLELPANQWTPLLIVTDLVTGVAGWIIADTGYSFLSTSKSPIFSLPSTSQMAQAKPKKEEIGKVTLDLSNLLPRGDAGGSR